MTKEWLNRKELAEWLGYLDDDGEPNSRVLEWMDYAGTGPPRYKIGRECRYRRDDILAWLESRRIEAGAKAP